MSIIDWLFIAFISISILCGFFGIIMIFRVIGTKKKLRELQAMTPPSKKKKKRMWLRKIKRLTQQVKKFRRTGLLLFLIGVLLTAGGFGGRYYQSTSLSKEDKAAIATGYYLTTEIDKQFNLVTEDPSRARTNLVELAGRMASYGVKKADGRINIEGQRVLNRYYKQMKEFGLNLTGQLEQVMTEEEIRTSYEEDLKKITDTQKNVAKYFKLKEEALSKRE